MWEPWPLATLWASKACNRDNFTFFVFTNFWDITPCSPLKDNRSFVGTYRLHLQTLRMEAICSSEISVHFQWTTRRYIPKDTTFHNHRCGNPKSYIASYTSFIKCKWTTVSFLRWTLLHGAGYLVHNEQRIVFRNQFQDMTHLFQQFRSASLTVGANIFLSTLFSVTLLPYVITCIKI
jgi:hypothetical protein